MQATTRWDSSQVVSGWQLSCHNGTHSLVSFCFQVSLGLGFTVVPHFNVVTWHGRHSGPGCFPLICSIFLAEMHTFKGQKKILVSSTIALHFIPLRQELEFIIFSARLATRKILCLPVPTHLLKWGYACTHACPFTITRAPGSGLLSCTAALLSTEHLPSPSSTAR